MAEIEPRDSFRLRRIGKLSVFCYLLTGVSVFLAGSYVFHLGFLGVLVKPSYLYLLVACLLPQVFIWVPPTSAARKDRVPWYDILLALVTFGMSLFLALKGEEMVLGGYSFRAPPIFEIIALAFWPLAIEAARRTGGLFFATAISVFSLYPLISGYSWMPDILRYRNVSPFRLGNYYMLGEDGLIGMAMDVYGVIFFGYMVLAMVLMNAGAAKFFLSVASALARNTRGGTAKISVIASGMFGSISGSPISNVIGTGSFTIPAMKRDGFSPEFAAATESVASTGGALMPPVMGTVAFIMTGFLDTHYWEICLAALLPSLFYYFSAFMQIDAYVAVHHLTKPSFVSELPSTRRILLDSLHIVAGLLILILFIFFLRLEAWAPWIASGSIVVLAAMNKKTRLGPRNFLKLLDDLSKQLSNLAGLMAPVGLIIAGFLITGTALAFPQSLINLSGGNLFLLLIMGAMASFILGMGMPLTGCYVILAIVLAPGLIIAGVNPLAAHLFVMYTALLSCITPPVAMAAYVAAGIANAKPLDTGFRAVRLGVAVYLVPFFFVVNPALILHGAPIDVAMSVVTCLIGLSLIAGSFEGFIWYVGIIKNIPVRVILLGAGLMLTVPELTSDIYGIGLAAITIAVYQVMKVIRRKHALGVDNPNKRL